MPDLSDLWAAFARLEAEIPDDYRSPVIQDRLAGLREPASARGRRGCTRNSRTVTAALSAAAAVAALTVMVTVMGDHADDRTPIGNHNATGQVPSLPASPPPSPVGTPPTSVITHPAPNGAMPATASDLIDYVQGGAPTAEVGYQQGSSQAGQPMRPRPGIAEFTTPSGNIVCGMMGAASTVSVTCLVIQHTYPTPPTPSSCHLNWVASSLSILSGEVSRGLCLGGEPFDPISTVLPYGSTLRHGSLACRSESAFLSCVDLATRHGFAVNRAEVRTY
jgi:hypothetical protein